MLLSMNYLHSMYRSSIYIYMYKQFIMSYSHMNSVIYLPAHFLYLRKTEEQNALGATDEKKNKDLSFILETFIFQSCHFGCPS